jgi:hypothetical protein
MKAFLIILFFVTFSASKLFAQATDYSSYEIAKLYNKKRNYVLCYKYLLIFKYSNLTKLQQSSNNIELLKLEGMISQMEGLLLQSSDFIQTVKVRGFSPADSTFKSMDKTITLTNIEIN